MVVDKGEKDCNAEFSKFYENNMFASKRLNLFVVLIVAKLLRANGGCLGVK